MPWVSYQKLRAELDIAVVMHDYGVELKGSGEQRKGMSPAAICPDADKPSLSVNVRTKLWKCWTSGLSGNVIDFAAHMEGLDPNDSGQFRRAAILLQEKYQVKSEKPPAKNPRRPASQGKAKAKHEDKPKRRKVLVNEPLDFTLKNLNCTHEAVRALGLAAETVDDFGLGLCSRKGLFEGQIAIPLRNAEGALVGYCGRHPEPGNRKPDEPLYRFPDKERVRASDNVVLRFDPSRLVYGADRLHGSTDELIVVDDLAHVWQLHEQEIPAVAVLASAAVDDTLCQTMAELVTSTGRAVFIGSESRTVSILTQLARHRNVRWLVAGDEAAVVSAALSLHN